MKTKQVQKPGKKKKMLLRLGAGIVVGGILGFAYYRLVGCSTGGCPITSNPYTSVIYGAVMGGLITGMR